MSNGAGEGDDWESMLDSGKLERNLENLKLLQNGKSAMRVDPFGDPLPSPQVGLSGTNLSDPSFSGPVRILTNGSRPSYRKPEPTMKILKRPEPQISKAQETQTPRNTMKSLEQREAEYAEARQRILGSDSSVTTTTTGGSKPNPTNNGGSKQNQQRPNGRKSVNGDIRPPKGPDGSKGFQMRR